MNDNLVNTYEQAVSELEKLIDKLEKGNLSLDEAIVAFQEGIKLASYCKTKLDEAEKRITILLEKQDGSFDEKDFTISE